MFVEKHLEPVFWTFDIPGGERVINIGTNAARWSVSNPVSDWLTLSEREGAGGDVRVTLRVISRTLQGRTGSIVVSAGTAQPMEVTVSQPASDQLFSLSADVSTIAFLPGGGTKDVTINTDASSWSIDAENAAWLQFGKATGGQGATTITITAAQNATADARTCANSTSTCSLPGPTNPTLITPRKWRC